MTDKGSGGGRLSGQVMCLVGALVAGVAVAVVAGLIGMSVYESQCLPDEECWALLGGLVAGLIAGAVAAAITVIVLAVRAGVGVAFGMGAAIAFLLAAGANLGWGLQGWAPLLYFGAALALVAGFVLSQSKGSLKPVAVLLLLAILGIASIPLVKEFNDVRQAQREIENLVGQPLQPELAGSDLWAVWSTRTGVKYSLLEPESEAGSRTGSVSITLRKLPASSAPCTGFADLGPAGPKDCTEIQPGVWRGRDGVKAYFWVRGEGGQWAHLSSSHYVGDASRQNARLDVVARSMRRGSSWTLAAAAAECPYCAPLA